MQYSEYANTKRYSVYNTKKVMETKLKNTVKVTRSSLVDDVYQDCHCDRQVVQSVIDATLDSIKDNLKDGATVELRGFGTFELRLRKGRKTARNPKTGEKVSSDPHYVVIFRSGYELKQEVMKLAAPNK